MSAEEYVLLLGVYAGTEEATLDLRDLTGPGGFADAVCGAGILHRRFDGATLQQSGGGTLGYGIGTGAAAGIVVGVIVGLPLAGAGVGAALGGLVGHRMRQQEVQDVVRVLAESIPVGATALVAVVQAESWPVLRGTLGRALRVTGWPLDDGPLLPFARSLVRGNPSVAEALDRSGDTRPPLDR